MHGTRTQQQKLVAVAGLRGLRLAFGGHREEAAGFAPSDAEVGTFVRGMLRLASVPVIEHGSAEGDDDAARLYTTVSVTRVVDLYSVSVAVELWDRVWLTRQAGGEALEAATWRQAAAFVSNRHELRQNTREQLGYILTHFLNDFVAANRDPEAPANGGDYVTTVREVSGQ